MSSPSILKVQRALGRCCLLHLKRRHDFADIAIAAASFGGVEEAAAEVHIQCVPAGLNARGRTQRHRQRVWKHVVDIRPAHISAIQKGDGGPLGVQVIRAGRVDREGGRLARCDGVFPAGRAGHVIGDGHVELHSPSIQRYHVGAVLRLGAGSKRALGRRSGCHHAAFGLQRVRELTLGNRPARAVEFRHVPGVFDLNRVVRSRLDLEQV